MSCSLNSGLPLGCRSSIAGIKTVYFANFENVTSVTASAGDVVTGITMSSTTKFYTFDLRRENAQYSEAITSSIQNGTLFYEGTLNLFLEKSQTSVRNQIMLLAAAKLMAIYLDKNGQYWLVGRTNGTDLTAGTIDSGKASADANGYNLTFMSQEAASAIEVNSSIISALVSY